MLTALDISVTYGRRRVLQQVGFGALPGQVTAIVGPNGSGKTTLMRALTGDISFAGLVMLNQCDVTTAKPWELATLRGVLPQSTPMAFPFTVVEVVRLGLSQGGRGAGGADGQAAQVSQALARVGLAGFEGRFYQELSGGEQQRVQLARVLSQVWQPMIDGVPRWLFLDEPVSALDIGHQLEVMQIARDYADAGGGVVTVMHDLNLTAMFSDTVALMSDGRILRQAPPDQVLQNDLLSQAYGCNVRVNTTPAKGTFLLPHAASLSGA